MFARYGLSHTVVTDNGLCRTSEEFQVRTSCNLRMVLTCETAQYNPASNGLAERMV